MLTVDPTDLAPCREFFDNPVGPHSPQLQRLLTIMRADTVDDPYVICEHGNGGFCLGKVSDQRGVPVQLYPSLQFSTYAEASRAMFKLRWETLTGKPLPLGEDMAVEASRVVADTSERILAYPDRWDVRAGERLSFKVSTPPSAAEFEFDVVRVRCAVMHKDGPGCKLVRVTTAEAGTYSGSAQTTSIGSYIAFDRDCPAALNGFLVRVNVKPTLRTDRPQCLLGTWCAQSESGFALYLNDTGQLSLTIGAGVGKVSTVTTPLPLAISYWYEASASYDPSNGRMTVSYRCIERVHLSVREQRTEQQATNPMVTGRHFFIAAWRDTDSSMSAHFNGKLEAPVLFASPLGDPESLVAAWDFSCNQSGNEVVDLSPNRWEGYTVNLPTRAVKGSRWNATVHQWTQDPTHYGAIHFHDDDVVDAGWEDTVTVSVPTEWRSGVYCGRFRQGEDVAYATFFVLPSKTERRSKLAVLMPTATYVCYGNDGTHVQRRRFLERTMNRFATLTAEQMYLQRHPELGASTYDKHSDGSGVCYASRHRPILGMEPMKSIWNFGADTLILDWLEHNGIEYDVLTDEALHHEGIALLDHYRCVISGSHPEYTSQNMSDAILEFLERGGRFIYTGANGFYWKIAYHPDDSGLIEIRRAEDGGRNWIADSGEYYLATTGELSGLWRRNGRTPQSLLGVGYTACGFDSASYYERTEASRNDRVAWIFEGIGEHEKIGDFGFALGGVAGAELDRADYALGTPPHALTVASAQHLSASYLTVPEEFYHLTADINGENSPLVRADMVFFETPSGGAVFSTGSISWCDGLSHNNYENNVAQITNNVVRRFMAPKAFDVTPLESNE